MKSLRIFEEKKQKEKKRKVKTERKLYRSYILSTWISCKKKTIQPTILCTLPNHYYTYKKKLNVKDTVILCFSNHSIILYMD